MAHTCLSLLAGLGAAGEAALDKLADGLYIISRHVADCVAERNGSSGAYALACSYTSALTALAAAATNRRKVTGTVARRPSSADCSSCLAQLFSVGTQRLMPVCLSIAAEGDASAQWIAHADLLLAASLLDEKHVDELSKGSLPEAEAGMVPVIASTQDTAGAKRRRVDNGEGRGGTHAYSEELFSSVSRLVSSDMTSGTAIAVGLARLLQVRESILIGENVSRHLLVESISYSCLKSPPRASLPRATTLP